MVGCKVYGVPTPKIQWLLNNSIVSNGANYTLYESMVANNIRWINITRSKSTWMEPSEFKYIAINDGGSDERKMTVMVKNASRIDQVNDSESDHVLTISILVASTVVVVVLLIMYYTFRRRQQLKKILSDTEIVNLNRLYLERTQKNSLMTGDKAGNKPDLSLDGKTDSSTFSRDRHEQHANGEEPLIKKDDPWEVPRSHIKVCSLLGEGNFGEVWKCEATDDSGVKGCYEFAVKTFKSTAGEHERLDLMQELRIMKNLEPHMNVIKLLGCCSEKDPLLIIMELAKLGTLQSVLRNSRRKNYYTNMHGLSSLTSGNLIKLCYQTANGMDFLSSKGIVHRDLATWNVLVTDEWVCKVSDFGSACSVDASLTYEFNCKRPLPVRWTAPEALYDNEWTVKSDVWSFGVLVWEVVTLGLTPYPDMSVRGVMEALHSGRLMDRPSHCGPEVYDVMCRCWQRVADDRPDFAELRDQLGAMLAEDTEYVKLDDMLRQNDYYNMSAQVIDELE